ncbi:MAG: hypothetical protein ABFC67_14690 [Mizugakiibacter sp.]|uniref:hypothetical protein n=1 Tax=Mizugakiibacter sp. TaxID=1972610 RepID=UPI00320C052F
MSETITLVCGFGRCGSSLVMQMLEAGGMPVTGEYPAFEAGDIVRPGSIDSTRLPGINGHALKLLDPQRYMIPHHFSTHAIWCRRDVIEQAKSHAKFLREVVGLPMNREHRDRIAQAFKEDAKFAIRTLREAGVKHILDLRFEDMICRPRVVAEQVSRFCGELDVDKMAAVVRSRDPECAPDMSLEFQLIEERESVNAE